MKRRARSEPAIADVYVGLCRKGEVQTCDRGYMAINLDGEAIGVFPKREDARAALMGEAA